MRRRGAGAPPADPVLLGADHPGEALFGGSFEECPMDVEEIVEAERAGCALIVIARSIARRSEHGSRWGRRRPVHARRASRLLGAGLR
jgi:hypothetical protein